ncbi:hypothetical protein LCM28_18725 [Salipiger pacificus]|nr:hypothetical protein [Alloyangia pacifica]
MFVLAELGTSDVSYQSFALAYGTMMLPEISGRSATWFSRRRRSLMRVGGLTEAIQALTSDPEKTRSEERAPRETEVPRIVAGAHIAPPVEPRG